MGKIAANMVVRNECNNYLLQVLDRLSTQVDYIVLTDDCSDDDTAGLAESKGCKVQRLDEPLFRKHEGQLRQKSWEWFEKNLEDSDTLVLAIDADEELYETGPKLNDFLEMRQYDVFSVVFFHMWNETHFRIDGGWRPHPSARLFRYMPGGSFKDRALACFAPQTIIRTKTGYRPIYTINVGDEVLTSDGTFHPVKEVMVREYKGTINKITTRTTPESILTTPEHPFLALKSVHVRSNQVGYCQPCRCERGKGLNYIGGKFNNIEISHTLDWIESKDLCEKGWLTSNWPIETFDQEWVFIPEEYLGTPNLSVFPCIQKRSGPDKFEVASEFLWVIGMYLAEGSSCANGIRFTLHEDEIEYHGRLSDFFKTHGYSVTIYDRKDSKALEVIVNSRTLGEWFPKWLGHGCMNKAIPAELLNLPNEKVKFILEGILDGDGTNPKERFDHFFQGALHQSSIILSYQVMEILFRLGGIPTVYQELTENRLPTTRITGTMWPRDSKKGAWRFEDKLLSEIASIKEIEYDGLVYNLSVEDDPTYTVGSTLVHNCGSEPTYVPEAAYYRRRFMIHTGLAMKHLSYIKDEDKLTKYQRYAEIDGGAFHAGAHIQSIIDPLERVTLDKWRFE